MKKEIIKLLLIEDNPGDARLVQEMLKEPGLVEFEVLVKERIDEALKILKKEKVDLVLLDLTLPDSSGIEAFRKIYSCSPELPIVIYSGQKDENISMEAIKEGAEDYITKGITDNHLLQQLLLYAIERKKRIAEMKKAEEKLKKSEEKFRSVFDNSYEGMALVDMKTAKINLVNKAACKMFGYTQEEVQALKLFKVYPKYYLPKVILYLKDLALKGYAVAKDSPVIRKDGTIFHVNVHASKMKIGGISYALGIFHDITEQKKIQEELLEAYKFNASTIEALPGVFYLFDTNGHFIKWNKNFTAVTEYSDEEMKEMTPLDLFEGEDKKHIESRIGETFTKGESDAEASFLTKSGKKIPYYFTGHKLIIDGISYLVGMGVDLTERKKTEGRFKVLFESSRDAVMTLAPPSWKFTSGNPATVEIFEAKDEADFISRAPWEFSPEFQPDGRPSADKAKEMIEKAMKEGSNFFEWTHRRLNGEDFPATVLLTRMELEGKKLLQATVRDITEQKKAEDALRHERDFAESLLNTVQVIMLVLDTKGHIVRFNQYMEELSGYSLDEVKGKDWFDTFIPPEDHKKICELFLGALDGVQTKGNINPIVLKDGEKCDIEWYDKTLKRDGDVVGVLSVGLDVTKRLKMEKDLQQSQKIEAIGQLAGGVAHDFNNIMTIILGSVESALSRQLQKTDKKDEKLISKLSDIKESALDASVLTKQLLTLGRKSVVLPEPINLKDSIEEMGATLRHVVPENISLKFLIAEDLYYINADRTQIKQVTLNLIMNAIDSIYNIGTITFEARNTLLDKDFASVHKLRENSPYVMLSINDTGHGIDNKSLEHIFEPFYTTKPVGKGTGLGLPTVFEIVYRLNGCITVESEIGKGTEFNVYIPALIGEHVVKASTPDEAISLEGTTILLAEDDMRILKMNEDNLLAAGATVLAAKDVDDAQLLASRHKNKITLCNSCSNLCNISHLIGQVGSQDIYIICQGFPCTGNSGNFSLSTKLSFCTHLSCNPCHL